MDNEFKRGMLTGMKIADRIICESDTEVELRCTIKGAIFVLEACLNDEAVDSNE